MYSYEELSDFDNFFYYGLGDLSRENASDLLAGLMEGIDEPLEIPGIDDKFYNSLFDENLGQIKTGNDNSNDNDKITSCPKCGFEYEI